MAELSQIELNGTTYDIKDTTARNAANNLAVNATLVSGLYISTNGKLTTLTSGNASDRTICIEAEPNKTYRIKKSTATVMRVGCGSSASLASGYSLSSYAGHDSASANELIVTTDSTNFYIYVQLFTNNDSSNLQSISANTSTLVIVEDFSKEIDDCIDAPASASSGDFLVYNGTAWVAQTLSTWQGGSY